jgi:hypothetical protein
MNNKIAIILIIASFFVSVIFLFAQDEYEFYEETMLNSKALSKTDQLESLMDKEMQKLGVQLYDPVENVEKRFGLKFRDDPYKDLSYEDTRYLCVDSDGFYIVLKADSASNFVAVHTVVFQLHKPPKLICDKQKVLNISQTYLNKPSQVLLDKFKGLTIEKSRDISYRYDQQTYEVSKYEFIVHKTNKEWMVFRNVGFSFSESPTKRIDKYIIGLGFEL